MKNLLLLLLISIPTFSSAQAHLFSSESEIKKLYPDKTFEIGYSEDGEKYIHTFMKYGTFFYYFDQESGLSNFCMQIIEEIPNLNGQVEAYNNQYVIISDNKWKAYLNGGGIININLEYNKEHEVYVFYYRE